MAFFDFMQDIPPYSEAPGATVRLNKRHGMIVAPFAADLKGARVLDLGAHDGRWSYALAAAGAAQVIGIEGRAELVERFGLFPETEFKARVDLRQGDLWQGMEAFIAAGERFDVIAVFGIYYHIMDHFRLLTMTRELGARLVLIDSEFIRSKKTEIHLATERVDSTLNAVEQVAGQQRAVTGFPTFGAMTMMANCAGYDTEWIDPRQYFQGENQKVTDYFRQGKKRRAFCALRARLS